MIDSVKTLFLFYLFPLQLSTHQFSRVPGRDNDALASLYQLLLTTLPGVNLMYYGDEIVMKNGEDDGNNIQDPVGRLYPVGNL